MLSRRSPFNNFIGGISGRRNTGDKLARGESPIKIHGQLWDVAAEIVKMDNMSAHADYQEILDWLRDFHGGPRKVFVTHGEKEAAAAMAEKIEVEFGWKTTIPPYGHQEEL